MRLTRDHILDEAFTLILTSGLRRASATELARRLGIVKSGLYHHFTGGKAEIIDATFEREETALIEAMTRAASGETIKERLVAVCRAKVSRITQIAHRFPLREEEANDIEGYLLSRGRFQRLERELLSRLLAEGMSTGEIREIPGDLVVAALQGALARVTKAFAISGGKRRLSVVDDLVGVLFRGIGRSEAV
jgi:AcrR family transcriptional regulator